MIEWKMNTTLDMFGFPELPKKPRVFLTDPEVETMRLMHENKSLGYRKLAIIFEVSRDTVRSICLYRRR